MPMYQELAGELTRWERRQQELISFLEELRTQGFVITPLQDQDRDGRHFLLNEIDPFTFFEVSPTDTSDTINVSRSFDRSKLS